MTAKAENHDDESIATIFSNSETEIWPWTEWNMQTSTLTLLVSIFTNLSHCLGGKSDSKIDSDNIT